MGPPGYLDFGGLFGGQDTVDLQQEPAAQNPDGRNAQGNTEKQQNPDAGVGIEQRIGADDTRDSP